MSQLSELLQKSRKIKRLTLRAVEEATGISNAYLSQLENGKVQRPSPQFLAKLSALYSVDYQSVMEAAGYVPEGASARNGDVRAKTLFNGEQLSLEEEGKLREYLAFLRSRG